MKRKRAIAIEAWLDLCLYLCLCLCLNMHCTCPCCAIIWWKPSAFTCPLCSICFHFWYQRIASIRQRMIRLLHTSCGIPSANACLHQSLFCTFLLPHAIYRSVSSNRHWFHIYNQIWMNAIYTRFDALLVCYLSITVVFACGTRLKLILYALQTLTCLWIAIYARFSVW